MDIPAEIERRAVRLAVIAAAKARLEARQREADLARGRGEEDECRPRHPDGTPERGPKYKLEFCIPADNEQEGSPTRIAAS